jgi:hypothetical protein
MAVSALWPTAAIQTLQSDLNWQAKSEFGLLSPLRPVACALAQGLPMRLDGERQRQVGQGPLWRVEAAWNEHIAEGWQWVLNGLCAELASGDSPHSSLSWAQHVASLTETDRTALIQWLERALSQAQARITLPEELRPLWLGQRTEFLDHRPDLYLARAIDGAHAVHLFAERLVGELPGATQSDPIERADLHRWVAAVQDAGGPWVNHQGQTPLHILEQHDYSDASDLEAFRGFDARWTAKHLDASLAGESATRTPSRPRM